MSAASIIAALETGLKLVGELAPVVATSLGGSAANVATIAGELASIGQGALNTLQGLSETDLTKLSDLTIALQAKNDQLAGDIAAS